MTPWERRLKDLWEILVTCPGAYLEPDTFRRSVNHFLQTARTVTFIIQKNHRDIKDYESWYPRNISIPLSLDPVMKWAVDSRNIIVKRGDLDLHSTLTATLIHSYLPETDIGIKLGRDELLNAGVKKLTRKAYKSLPTGAIKSAVIRIERRWVTEGLPDRELLGALTYIYARLYACCAQLAIHIGCPIDSTIPRPQELNPIHKDGHRTIYVKLSDSSMYSEMVDSTIMDPNVSLPEPYHTAVQEHRTNAKPATTSEALLDHLDKSTELAFRHCGYHEPLLILYDATWRPLHYATPQFDDQAAVFIFWRHVADRVLNLHATGLAWIAESSLRSIQSTADGPVLTTPPNEWPVVAEQLQVFVLSAVSPAMDVTWEIDRTTNTAHPTLIRQPSAIARFGGPPDYFVPALRALHAGAKYS